MALASTGELGSGWLLFLFLAGSFAAYRTLTYLFDAGVKRDVQAGRYDQAIARLVKRSRFAEAAHVEERRGNLDAAAALFIQAADVPTAAQMYIRHGRQKYAVAFFAEPHHLDEAAAVFLREGQMAHAAEMYEKAGRRDRALEIWQDTGRQDRVAAMMAQSGDTGGASRLLADSAMASGDYAAAGPLWEELGELVMAGKAYKAAGMTHEAVRLAVELGHPGEAARLLMEAGEFLQAAPLFATAGRYADAGSAAYRGGDVAGCVAYLEIAGDHVAMAHVFFSYGRRDDAKARLRSVKPSHEDFVACREALAAAELEDGEDEAARNAYGELVEHAVATRLVPDDTVRRWLISRFELFVTAGEVEQGLLELEHCRSMGLLTVEVEEHMRRLAPQVEATRTILKQGDEDAIAVVLEEWNRAASSLLLPRHERYEIQQKLAQGSNGVVYLAWDAVLDRPLVVKMIANDALPTETAREWFLREARVAARLNHPNIVVIYDMGEIGEQPFIAMEYVEGMTLKERVAPQLPLPARMVVPLFQQLGAALQFAHDHGVVHRDVKLDNVMVTTDGALKLMDFGLAEALNSPERTRVVVAGTPAYMSPEQIRGTGVDHLTDIYALGVLLFKLVTGEYPYRSGNILEQHRKAPIPDARELEPHVPDACNAVIQKAMAKDKADRFSSVDELVIALAAVE